MVVGAGLSASARKESRRASARPRRSFGGGGQAPPWRGLKPGAPHQKRESLGVSWVKESVHVESHAAK